MTTYIQKRSGQRERFSIERVNRSLHKSRVPEVLIENICSIIQDNPPKTTKELHDFIVTYLENQEHAPLAARYNLKSALFDFGPDGFYFEQFIAHLLKAMSFNVQTNITMPGVCVDHEIDVLAYNSEVSYFIECKFHNQQGIKSDIKIPLYVQARFEDIKEHHQHTFSHEKVHLPWCVTNTAFSAQALAYATCKKMRMLDWRYPEKENLAFLVDYYALHPITALTMLSRPQKQKLMEKGLILCKDVQRFAYIFKELGFSSAETASIIAHAAAIPLVV